MRNGVHGRLTVVAAALVLAFALTASPQGQMPVGIPGPPPPPPPPSAFGQPAQTPPETGTGFVTGAVIDATTNRPIPRATVSLAGLTAAMLGAGLLNDPGAAPRQVLTDNQGRFVFRALAKGLYTLRSTAPGYVAGGLGQSRPNGPSQSLELEASDSKHGDLIVRMWKSGTITGTITDETGEPAIGVTISAVRRTFVSGQPRFTTTGSNATDDRGFYRITNLIPGDYVIGIITSQSTVPVTVADGYRQMMSSGGPMASMELSRELQSSGASMAISLGTTGHRVGEFIVSSGFSGRGGLATPPPVENQRMMVYPTTFYPSAAAVAQGTILKIASGDARNNVDMQLKLVPALTVSGTLTGPDGPARNTGLRMIAAGMESFQGMVTAEGTSAVTDGNGAFTFLGITPGQYSLKVVRVPRPVTTSSGPSTTTRIEVAGPGGMTIMSMSGVSPGVMPAPPPFPPEPAVYTTAQVNVGDDNISGLSLTLQPGARLSGRVQFEGSQAPPAADQMQRISLNVASNEPRVISVPAPMTRVDGEGRFNTQGYAPGRYQVQAFVPSIPNPGGMAAVSSWMFKSAMLNGRDLADDPLEIGSEDIDGIVITFTDRPTSLEGTVTDLRGQPDKSAEVVVFPADSQGWRQGMLNNRRVRAARASLTGKFTFNSLPAGDYYAVAITGGASGEIQDPKFLETLIASATRVTVADGAKARQDLTSKSVK
jgi:protocatechuate 3,4-dioxygenase beta subunit